MLQQEEETKISFVSPTVQNWILLTFSRLIYFYLTTFRNVSVAKSAPFVYAQCITLSHQITRIEKPERRHFRLVLN